MTERAPSSAELAGQLEVMARRVIDLGRRLTDAGWRQRAASGLLIADVVQGLVGRLAALEHAVATGAATRPEAWRSPAPPPYPRALPDRLAVVTNDLVAALRSAPADQMAWQGDELVPVVRIAAAAVAQARSDLEAIRSAGSAG